MSQFSMINNSIFPKRDKEMGTVLQTVALASPEGYVFECTEEEFEVSWEKFSTAKFAKGRKR